MVSTGDGTRLDEVGDAPRFGASVGSRSAVDGGGAPEQERVFAGRYTLGSFVGRGAVAEVWRAIDHVTHRPVAIKLLHAHHCGDGHVRERLEREARAYGQLRNQHIVRIFDVGSEGGTPFLVLEYVPGADLKQVREQRGRLDPAAVVAIAYQVADALAAAHRSGLAHRDVKPSNILIGRDGRARLTDFGLARTVGDSRLTSPGGVIGSPGYIAPEQLDGTPGDARSDVYALGLVLWECLTGDDAFHRDSPLATALARLTEQLPAARGLRPDVPAGLDRLITAATRKDPRQRPANGTALLDSLRPLVASLTRRTSGRLVAGLLGGPAGTQARNDRDDPH